MFSWLTRFKKAEYAPHYSALKANPSKGLPAELKQQKKANSSVPGEMRCKRIFSTEINGLLLKHPCLQC